MIGAHAARQAKARRALATAFERLTGVSADE